MSLGKGQAAYNYEVSLKAPQGAPVRLGSFADVTGVGSPPSKIQGLHKQTDVTLKRGVVSSVDLSSWLKSVRAKAPSAMRDLIVTLHDDSRVPVRRWVLRNASPMKYTGPTLSGKGTGDIAMEELVLSAEGVEVVPVS